MSYVRKKKVGTSTSACFAREKNMSAHESCSSPSSLKPTKKKISLDNRDVVIVSEAVTPPPSPDLFSRLWAGPGVCAVAGLHTSVVKAGRPRLHGQP